MEQNRSIVKITTAIVMITAFITPFTGNAINLGIPQIGREYGLDQFGLSWIVTSYLMASAAFLLPFGCVANIKGRKKVFPTGMFFFSVTSLGCGLALSFPVTALLSLLSQRDYWGKGGLG
ncbi:MFS transporter [Desulfosporosinus shakirovi]|uniref:MFS transporter n=1 Tax=Desulfosporosinus shakirovi TaxID=2885154 RepID=UPI001E56F53C|nr:MFS transporter [Desulfosporosinus sp. SRJS8]MCB8815428.1 MFS transporter [Desulfosporosinus sp. SRJS8]